ncbi:MAG: hypothetical protein QOE36_1108 [Gaiellaceae bacterium]|nr:hypothetical protein [Gaiellaceae bacterium]
MADEQAPDTGGGALPWALVLQVLAAGAALAAWVSVVGGARVWARYYAAGFAPRQSVPLQPRSALVGEGIATLILPLAVAGLVALVVFFASPFHPRRSRSQSFEEGFAEWRAEPEAVEAAARWWRDHADQKLELASNQTQLESWLRTQYASAGPKAEDEKRLTETKGWRHSIGVLEIAPVVVFVGLVIWQWGEIRPLYIVWAAAVTLIAIVVGHVAVANSATRRQLAVPLFMTVSLWVGALAVLGVAGTNHPKLALGLVLRKTHDPIAGFFIARVDGDVYIAERLPQRPEYRIVMVPKDDVADFSYGPLRKVTTDPSFKSQQLQTHLFRAVIKADAKRLALGDSPKP